jgi:hypothetical protein
LFHASPIAKWVQYTNNGDKAPKADTRLPITLPSVLVPKVDNPGLNFNIRDTAHSWVGLLMINHMMGKTYPGGVHLGLINLLYQFGSSLGTTLGANTCFDATLNVLSLRDPKKLEQKITMKDATSSNNGNPKIVGIDDGNLLDRTILPKRKLHIRIDSTTTLTPTLMKRDESESLQPLLVPPPRNDDAVVERGVVAVDVVVTTFDVKG